MSDSFILGSNSSRKSRTEGVSLVSGAARHRSCSTTKGVESKGDGAVSRVGGVGSCPGDSSSVAGSCQRCRAPAALPNGACLMAPDTRQLEVQNALMNLQMTISYKQVMRSCILNSIEHAAHGEQNSRVKCILLAVNTGCTRKSSLKI